MAIKRKLPQRDLDAAMAWLVRLNSPALTPAEETQFFVWLEASPVHQAAYLKAEQLWLRGDVLAQARKPAASRQLLWLWGGAAAAACMACVVWLSITLMAPSAVIESYATVQGEQREVTLADGTVLYLNTGSNVQITYTPQGRMAQLNAGEVFFAVKPNPARPFDVQTQQGWVRVLGTRFAVRQLAGDALITVVEGKVAVGAGNTDKAQPLQTLTANQQLSIVGAEAGRPVVHLDAQSATAWRQQRLVFDETPLGDVVAELNRYLAPPLALANGQLASLRVTAVIQLQNSTLATAQTLAQSLGLTVIEQPSQVQLAVKP